MSNDDEPPKIGISMDTVVSAMLSRLEKYGLATLLLLLLIYWAKPHLDDAIRSHGKLIDKTVETQAIQAVTLDTATKTLERIDRVTVDTNAILREQQRVAKKPVAAGEAP